MIYRREIDGLRTIAVTSVIVHHAGFVLHGGFLGVDIFFVISGFLITGILLRELDAGRFSLRHFYDRRIRRILPALVLVALCSLPVAWVLMPPEQMTHFARSLLALPVFATNFLFWQEAGYFEPDAAEIPMIHTWSLAVEEQFYVFFPLIMMLIWKVRKSLFVPLVIAATVASVGLAEIGVRNWPSAAFYLLPFRAWELLAGALAAYYTMRVGRVKDGQYRGLTVVPERANQALSLLGFGLVCVYLIVFTSTSGSPGYRVVPLVVGTLLILLFATPATLVNRLLSLRVMVGLGLISYSAYLWHQPLFAFARIASLDPPSQTVMLGLIGVTFALSYLSWRWVEEPFRRGMSLRRVLVPVVSGFVVLTAFGVVALQTNGLANSRFNDQQANWFGSVLFSPERDACHGRPDRLPPPQQACVYGGQAAAPTWAVLGDSHGVEIAYAVSEELKSQNQTLVHLTASACAPAYEFESGRRGCSDWTVAAVDWLIEQPDIQTVVLSYRHLVHLYPDLNPTDLDALLSESPRIAEGETAQQKREQYWISFEAMVQQFLDAGKRVIVMAPVPEIGRHIDKYILLGSDNAVGLTTIPRSDHDDMVALLGDRLERLSAEILDPTQVFCDDAWCYGANADGAFYFDNNHLSVAGAQRLVAPLFGQD